MRNSAIFTSLCAIAAAAACSLPTAGLAQAEVITDTFVTQDGRRQILADGTPVVMRVPISEPGTATTVAVSVDITTPIPQDLYLFLTSPNGTGELLTVQDGVTPEGIVIDQLEIPAFAGEPIEGTWVLQVANFTGNATSGSILNSFAVTVSRPGVNGVAYANLIEAYIQLATDSYNAFNSSGDSLRALASLFYYYAFVGYYQSELDGNPALRDFSYYFFLAYYQLNINYAEGNPDEAIEQFYNFLAVAYYQFYDQSGYPGLAQQLYDTYRALGQPDDMTP